MQKLVIKLAILSAIGLSITACGRNGPLEPPRGMMMKDHRGKMVENQDPTNHFLWTGLLDKPVIEKRVCFEPYPV